MLSDDEIESINALVNPPADEAAKAAHDKLVADALKVSTEFRQENLPMAPTHRWPMEKHILSQQKPAADRSDYRRIFKKLRRQLAS